MRHCFDEGAGIMVVVDLSRLALGYCWDTLAQLRHLQTRTFLSRGSGILATALRLFECGPLLLCDPGTQRPFEGHV